MATTRKVKPKCYECGREIEGRAGYTYEKITSHGFTRYYCYECIEKLSDEALAQEKKTHE